MAPNSTTTTSANPSPKARKTNVWRHSHSLALSDLKSRWRRGILWTTYLAVVIIFILALSIAISSSTPTNKPKFDDSVACLPDGRFSLDPGEFDFWGYGGFFEITMGYGQFTFTQAKAIDVGWDVVVGRGGQALLALISSSVFARYITTTMQVSPITFNTFKTIFVARDANTATGVSRLIRDFTRRKSLPNKAATVFMVVTMVYVLIFPTFVSSMSGYSANVQAFVEDQSERYVPFSDFTQLYYTIHDAERIKGDGIKLSNDTRITSLGLDREPILVYDSMCGYKHRPDFQAQCQLLEDVTNYILDYGTEGATNNETVFGRRSGRNIIIPAPSLNIEAHYIPYDFVTSLKSVSWNNPFTNESDPQEVRTPGGGTLNLLDDSRMQWTVGGSNLVENDGSDSAVQNVEAAANYSQSYIEEHGKCQPTTTYKWGFSFIQLFLMVLFLTLWSTGTYTLYIRSSIAMLKRNTHTPVAGEYQAVFQLADAMAAQLDSGPENVEKAHRGVVSEEQLRKRIGKELKGGRISYKDSLLQNEDARAERSGWKTSDWIMEEVWWLALLGLATAGCLLTAWFFPYVIATYLLPLQVVFAMYVGQSAKSRVVLLGWAVLGLSVVPTGVVVGMAVARPR